MTTESELFAFSSLHNSEQLPSGKPILLDELSVDRLKLWVEELPLANVGQSSRLIHKKLTEIVHAELPYQEKFDLLEVLQPPCNYVTNALKRHFVNQPLPLSKKGFEVATLATDYHHTLAIGYKQITDKLPLSVSDRSLPLLNSSISRILEHLSQIITITYQTYSQPPAGVWHDIHQLYNFAEKLSIQHDNVNTHNSEALLTTIYKQYVHAILLSLSMPNRLPQKELSEVSTIAYLLADSTSLQRDSHSDNINSRFVIDFSSDKPPVHQVFYKDHIDQDICTLDTSRLAEDLKGVLLSGRNNVCENTIRRLTDSWCTAPKRATARIHVNESATVAVGLSDIHYFINESLPQNNNKKEYNHRSVFDSKDITAEENNVWDMVYPFSDGDLISSLEEPDEKPNSHKSFQCKIIDQSDNGLCMSWPKGERSHIQIGGLIAFQTLNDFGKMCWNAGIIRWISNTTVSQLEFGLETLSSTPKPVTATIHQSNGSGIEHQCLLLPEKSHINQSAVLITPHSTYHTGTTINIKADDFNETVTLETEVNNTVSFSQFLFSMLSSEDEPSGDAESERFNNLWTTL